MPYAINQAVIFVGPDLRTHPLVLMNGAVAPKPGDVYHIRAAKESVKHPGQTYLLREITNDVLWVNERFLKPFYRSSRTDISSLERFLDPKNLKVLVRD